MQKRMQLKSEILWSLMMMALLGISFWLCRYVFFDLHGMKQYPAFLAVISLAIMIIAALFRSRIVSAAVVIGYMGGFILAMIFNTDGLDPGGGTTNNAWIIWGSVLFISVLAGFAGSLVSRHKRRSAGR